MCFKFTKRCQIVQVNISSLYRKKKHRQVIDLYESNKSDFDKSSSALLMISGSYASLKLYNNAIAILNTLIHDDFELGKVLPLISFCYSQSGAYRFAIQTGLIALKHNLTSPLAYNSLGVAFMAEKRYGEGIQALLTACELQPDNYDAWANLGNAYVATADYKNAINTLQKAVALSSTDKSACDNLMLAICFCDHLSDKERDRVIAIKEREDEMQRRHNNKMLILSGFILLSIIGLGAILLNKESPKIIPVGINQPPAIEDQSKYSYLIKCPDEGCSGALRYIKEYNFFGCSNYKKDKTGCDETLKAPFRCSEHDTKFKTRVENDRGDIRYWVCDRFDICRLKFKYADIFSNHVICPTDGCRGILKLNSENPNYKFLGCPNWKDNGCSTVKFPLVCPAHKKIMRLNNKKTHWICEHYPKCKEYYHYK